MPLSDLIDPEKAPAALVKLALVPLILVVVCQVIAILLSRLSAFDIFLFLLFLMLASPLAYLIRQARIGRPQRGGAPRGAERTPILPSNEEDQ